MLKIHFNFNYKKATQELNYFATKQGGRINKLKALKLVYLADRYHLRKYGRLITNDVYFAMNYGPVPSGVKDIAEASEFLGEIEKNYSSQYLTQASRLMLETIKHVDEDVFSDSDMEALDFVWQKFGHLAQFGLAKLTHAYPEWKKHNKALDLDSRIQMDLEDFLEDPDTNVEKCFELSDHDKSLRREQLAESFKMSHLWR